MYKSYLGLVSLRLKRLKPETLLAAREGRPPGQEPCTEYASYRCQAGARQGV